MIIIYINKQKGENDMNIFKFFKKRKEEKIQRDKILQEYIDNSEFNLSKNVIYYFKYYLYDAFIIDKNLGCGILCRKCLLQNSTLEIYNYIMNNKRNGIIVNYNQFKDIKLIPYSIIFKELMIDKEIVDEDNFLYIKIDNLCIRNCCRDYDSSYKSYRWLSINGKEDSVPDILNAISKDHKYFKLILDNLYPIK